MDNDLPIGPTRYYVIVCRDGRKVEVDAESMWPAGSPGRSSGPPWTSSVAGRSGPQTVIAAAILRLSRRELES
jgi:hypothetical protein